MGCLDLKGVRLTSLVPLFPLFVSFIFVHNFNVRSNFIASLLWDTHNILAVSLGLSPHVGDGQGYSDIQFLSCTLLAWPRVRSAFAMFPPVSIVVSPCHSTRVSHTPVSTPLWAFRGEPWRVEWAVLPARYPKVRFLG